MQSSKRLTTAIQELTGFQPIENLTFGDIHPECQVLMMRRLSSKKNRVHHIHTVCGDLVIKQFFTGKALKEYHVLEQAERFQLKAPKPYAICRDFIVMEYVKGVNMCDVLNELLETKHVVQLAEWFAAFHNAFEQEGKTLIKSDAILKNFLNTENGVIGLDYEFAHVGNPVEDVGEMICHILNTNPMFIPRKYVLCHIFVDAYRNLAKLPLSNLHETVAQALGVAATFRPNQSELLHQKAREIRRKGDTWLTGL
jgi:tRNA A-37 threonylcarbamoyl transferase component Bud32